jgi:small subunit ribosomal protein S7
MAGKYFESLDYLLKPDPVYGDANVAKFINCIMKDGKRSTAQTIFYGALALVEVRSKRVGGANYQVPVEVSSKRQRNLSYRWILEAARGRKGKPLHVTLAEELGAAYNKEGGAYLKRENTHKQAEANKAFAHFAW